MVQDVHELLDIDEPEEVLETTIALAKELLKHGLLAGDSPVHNDCVHFQPWPNQDPEAVVALIRREWAQRPDFPSWGDGPWFAAPRESRG
jgi:hypothetical protein